MTALLVIQIMPVKYSIVKDQTFSCYRGRRKSLSGLLRIATFGFLFMIGALLVT